MSLKGLQGKVAVVTGGADGIGAAAVRRLSREGANVVVVDLDGSAAKQLVDSLPTPGFAIEADASLPETAESYVSAAVQEYGRLDIAHLNVAVGNKPGYVADSDLADFDRVMNINVRGAYLGLRAVLRQFLAQGGGGSIVLTSSINGIGGTPGSTFYVASKHAIVGLVRSTAREYGPNGIRINALLPGFTETRALTDLIASTGDGEAFRAMMESTVPLGRWAKPDEIGDAVAWLLSDESSFVTGSTLVVDGGATCGATSWERFTANDDSLKLG